jgi:hypothetical protein
MKQKLNFWQLCWKRYSSHQSFFDMFKEMTMELDERKRISWIAARTVIQTVAILAVIGIIVFIINWFYPHDKTIDKILIIGPVIALGIISLVLYLAYCLSKGFTQYVDLHNRFTSGGGYYDGLDISSIIDDINPTKKLWKWFKKRLK